MHLRAKKLIEQNRFMLCYRRTPNHSYFDSASTKLELSVVSQFSGGREDERLSDKVGNLYNDPDKKLRKYLQGGKIEQSGEWTP